MIAPTPVPPYYAVIFTSVKNPQDEGYAEMAASMETLASRQPGYLGFESARSGTGISVSYWTNPEAIKNWKLQAEHLLAQKYGREKWYLQYKVRVCLVERDYFFNKVQL
jgi:heme-degrading monooxygenase HmoA